MSASPVKVLSIIVSAVLSIAGGALFFPAPAGAREMFPAPPAREVRAVWVTTVGGLDWPKTTDTAGQKAALSRILETLDAAHFNTIFFQVRGRGDVMYRSSIEPWAASLTDTPGRDPGWDPLKFVITEAHARGMEVHAWFNTYFVRGSPSPPPATDPPHVIRSHPDWVRIHGEAWWIDPGIPEARTYLVNLVEELVREYDVDGLQMDYIRYPGRNFDDAKTYVRLGGGMKLDEWRRWNVTELLRQVAGMVSVLKPWVKLGCTPIGIYTNPDGVRGLESYSDVFQDSYRWVREGLVDYIVPQLYWPLGGENGDPDFAMMAAEWRKQATGRHLYLGIGSYKPEVERQTRSLVDAARKAGTEGVAFFRYSSLSGILSDTLFAGRALPPPMIWKDSVPPPSPGNISVVNAGEGVREVRWSVPAGGPLRGGPQFTCLYRVRGGILSPATTEELIGVYPPGGEGVRDTVPTGFGDEVTYAVTTLSRSGLESIPAGETRRSAAAVAVGVPVWPAGLLLGTPFAPEGSDLLFVPVRTAGWADLSITVMDTSRVELLRTWEGKRHPGDHVVSLDISSLHPGLYRCRVRTGELTTERDFIVPD